MQRFYRSILLAVALLQGALTSPAKNPPRWLHKISRACAKALRISINVHGNLPECGLLVANHLGYLDILAIGSIFPCRFVSKSDVRHWPVFGFFARRAGSLFVNRQNRSDIAITTQEMLVALQTTTPVVIFPEGTSSGGFEVLPFYSSLLEPALATSCEVTPLAITYRLPGGKTSDQMAYHGSMTLVPHLWNVLGLHGMEVHLHFGTPRRLCSDRKTAARHLREEITEMLHAPTPAEAR